MGTLPPQATVAGAVGASARASLGGTVEGVVLVAAAVEAGWSRFSHRPPTSAVSATAAASPP